VIPPVAPAAASRSRVMQEGDSVSVWREEDEHPLRSFLTRSVAAARAVGFQLESEHSYWSAVEDDGTETGKRETGWIWRGDQKVKFSPAFPAEEITLREFERRFSDLEWVTGNPHHPISHMRWFYEVLVKTLEEVKTLGTSEKIRRDLPGSKLFCLIPQGATPEERAAALEQMNSLI